MRRSEVDLVRLAAMIMMAVYHGAFDLSYFYGWNIDLDATGWRLLQHSTLTLFLLVSGISAVLLWKRTRAGGDARIRTTFTRRAMILLAWSMLITIATYVVDPATSIRFGVLHCIAVTTLLLPFLLPLGAWNAVLGIAVIAIGVRFPFPQRFVTLDYVPLLPWAGVILLGTALGHALYVRGWRSETLRLPHPLMTLSQPGRYSLAFYLLHQPLLLAVMTLLLGMPRTFM